MPPKYLPSDPCCTAGGKPSTNTTSTGAEAVNSPLVDVENAAFSEQHSGGGGGDAAEGSDDEEEGDSDDDDDSRCVFPNGFCMWDDEEACASNGDVEVHGPGDLATGSQDLDDTFQDSAGQVNLIEYVFVGPAWLNDAIKGVTDKEAMAEVERERYVEKFSFLLLPILFFIISINFLSLHFCTYNAIGGSWPTMITRRRHWTKRFAATCPTVWSSGK